MASPNQRVSEYVLGEKIGVGTHGEVWVARHHVWADHRVAIKIPTDDQYVRNLQREGVAIHGLVHPNIVRAIGFDPYASPPYLVMEYVPGTSLRPLITDRVLGVNDSVAILKQVLAGLAHAHANGMVHRDIKPENILIHEKALAEGYGAEGAVKLTDFGLGKAAVASTGSIMYSTSLGGGEGGRIVGTLDYMAPEQRSGAEVDARADLYACGVVLFEMLTGERPAGTEVPGDLNDSVPRHLDEVFRRAYTRLEKRFASAEEFLHVLAGPPPLPPALPETAGLGIRGLSVACPHCRQPVDRSDQFCMHCGVQLVATVRRCGRCGAYPDPGDEFCIYCGQVLAGPQVA